MGSKSFWIFISLFLMVGCSANQPEPTIILPTLYPSPTMTFTPSQTPTQTLTPTPSFTPTYTLTPSFTPTFTLTPSLTPTVTPTFTETPTFFESSTSSIDERALMTTIANLQNFSTRHANSIFNNNHSGIDMARQYLYNEMKARAETCAVKANLYQDSFTLEYASVITNQINLVAEVPGIAPGAITIIVGAHYDTIRGSEPENSVVDQPGADDNGSGVAATLELLRLICLAPRQMTFVFVLFAAEEPGLGRNGSRHFVNDFMPRTNWRVEGMLNLDTIGSATDERGAIKDDFARIYSASNARHMARQIQAASFVQMPDFRISIENSIDRQNRWGDHMSFTDARYTAVRLFEGSEDVVRQDTNRDLLNDIDPDYLAKMIRVSLAYLLGMSEGAPAPTGIQMNGGNITWNPVPGAAGYLVVQRPYSDHNYLVMRIVTDTSITLATDNLFAIGTIGSNMLLGRLSGETYIAP